MASYVFGPVPSRRLGLSLGVDLIPPKTCTFDCLYCQVGKTTCKTIEAGDYVPIEQVIEEIGKRLESVRPDYVTLAGSGEPTLNARIDKVIEGIKEMSDVPIALLTNGSLLWSDEILKKVLGADVILPTLTSVNEKTFREIHRPHRDLRLDRIIEGLRRLCGIYGGHVFLEVVLLAGINDTEGELENLKRVIDQIPVEKIQLNTVVRPPTDSRAIALDRKALEEIMHYMGQKAEIIADVPIIQERKNDSSHAEHLLAMIGRRPLRAVDAARAMGLPPDEVQSLIKGLLLKGLICGRDHDGELFYVSREKVGRES